MRIPLADDSLADDSRADDSSGKIGRSHVIKTLLEIYNDYQVVLKAFDGWKCRLMRSVRQTLSESEY